MGHVSSSVHELDSRVHGAPQKRKEDLKLQFIHAAHSVQVVQISMIYVLIMWLEALGKL